MSSRWGPKLERLDGRRLPVVLQTSAGKAELAGALREPGLERCDRLQARLDQPCSELGHALGPRLDCRAARESTGDPPQRGVSLGHGGAVLRGERRPGRREAAERAIEVGAPDDRPALDHREPVGREDERRSLGSQLLRRSQRGSVETRPLRLADAKDDLELERRGAA